MSKNMNSVDLYYHSQRTQDFSEIPVESNPLTTPFLDSNSAFNASMVLFSLFTLTLLAWVLKILKTAGVSKKVSSQLAAIQSFQQIPCSKCRYFNSNPYLKCAVNPSTVLSDKAIECSEYNPGSSNNSQLQDER